MEATAPGGEGGGWAARRGAAAPAQPPTPPSHRPSPRPPPRPPSPRPSAPSLTSSLRLASAPALSSNSTQGTTPLSAAQCSAVLFICRDAAAAPHTRVSGGGGSGGRVPEADATPPSPPRAPHSHSPARSPAGLHASWAAEGRQPAAERQRGAAVEGRSGASGAPPARGAAGQRRAASPAHPLIPHPSPGSSGWRPWR